MVDNWKIQRLIRTYKKKLKAAEHMYAHWDLPGKKPVMKAKIECYKKFVEHLEQLIGKQLKLKKGPLAIISPAFFWEWTDVGFMLRFFRQSEHSPYAVGFDLQILFFNMWVQFYRREDYSSNIHKGSRKEV